MAITMALPTLVRRLTELVYSDGSNSNVMTPRGDLSVAQGLPPDTELVRLGKSYSCQIATGSAFTNVAGMPTTRAELALYNGDATKSLVIDYITFLSLTSITALSNVTLIYQVASVTALANDTAQLINSPLGKAYGGSVTRAVAVTTMTANKWTVVASATNAATASIGFGAIARVNGGIIVRPGYTIGINAVVGTATGTSLMGIGWHEVTLPIAS